MLKLEDPRTQQLCGVMVNLDDASWHVRISALVCIYFIYGMQRSHGILMISYPLWDPQDGIEHSNIHHVSCTYRYASCMHSMYHVSLRSSPYLVTLNSLGRRAWEEPRGSRRCDWVKRSYFNDHVSNTVYTILHTRTACMHAALIWGLFLHLGVLTVKHLLGSNTYRLDI